MPDDEAGADHQEGDAADAIRNAEVALAHQNSTTAQVDLQVVAAVLNAHQKAEAGKEALTRLQQDIEGAVLTRSDLDTPAGARDFQRFLIGKLRDIRAVVAGASLDDTSSSAMMAAWTSLYNAGQAGDEDAGERHPPGQPADGTPATATEPGLDPYFDDDAAMPFDDVPGQAASAPSPMAMPGVPAFGGGSPSSAPLPGLGLPAGFATSQPSDGDESRREPALRETDDDPLPDEDDHQDTDAATGRPVRSDPTTVTLPNGETLTAASPQLAAAIEAAAAGTPIADAFQHEGITIPPPGTAVPEPLDPARLAPGDIGMFTDRHALSLGERRALVDGQIQDISTVTGPSFLGWEHPPIPVGTPAKSDQPAPTRPATASSTETA